MKILLHDELLREDPIDSRYPQEVDPGLWQLQWEALLCCGLFQNRSSQRIRYTDDGG